VRRLACQGVVLDQVLAWRRMSGFACGYAGTGFVLSQGLRTKPGGADRDRTDDLLNAIRTLYVDPGVSGGSGIDEVDT
jgi:hypothetical protein